jgi:hypothetical protein
MVMSEIKCKEVLQTTVQYESNILQFWVLIWDSTTQYILKLNTISTYRSDNFKHS